MPSNKLTPEEQARRFDRLPAWARDEMKRLQYRAFRAEEELAAHRSGAYGPADTDTVVSPYREVPLNLPKGATVEFRLGDHRAIRVRVVDGEIELNGDGRLHMTPDASNHLRVRTER